MLTPSVLRTPLHAPLVRLISPSPGEVRPDGGRRLVHGYSRHSWRATTGPKDTLRHLPVSSHRAVPRVLPSVSPRPAVCRTQTVGVSPFSPSHCGSPLPTGGGLARRGVVCLTIVSPHSMNDAAIRQAGIVLFPVPPTASRETRRLEVPRWGYQCIGECGGRLPVLAGQGGRPPPVHSPRLARHHRRHGRHARPERSQRRDRRVTRSHLAGGTTRRRHRSRFAMFVHCTPREDETPNAVEVTEPNAQPLVRIDPREERARHQTAQRHGVTYYPLASGARDMRGIPWAMESITAAGMLAPEGDPRV